MSQQQALTFDAYQEQAYKTAKYMDNENVSPNIAQMYPVLALAEETGEVCGKIAKAIRKGVPVDTDAVIKELGDVLWNVSAICTDISIPLGVVAALNIEKLADREGRGVIVGEGDER